MNTLFVLCGMFNRPTLTIEQVAELIQKAPQTIRNRVSAGTFPRPTSDGVWLIQDIADYLDSTRAAPAAPKAA